MKKILFYLITTIMILIPINVQANSKITYQSHISNVGWQKTTIDGSISGTTGQAKRIEAIKINFNNQTEARFIRYKSHVSNIGCMKWVNANNISGTTGQGLALEGYQIKLVKKKKQRTMIKKMNMFQK